MASVWNLWVWLKCIALGVVSGRCCKEVYRRTGIKCVAKYLRLRENKLIAFPIIAIAAHPVHVVPVVIIVCVPMIANPGKTRNSQLLPARKHYPSYGIHVHTIIINFPYSTCISSFLAAASLHLCSFLKRFSLLVYVIFVQYIANVTQRTFEIVQKIEITRV